MKTAKSVFQKLDFDNDGCISFSEWSRAMTMLPKATVWTAFDEFHRAALTISEDPVPDDVIIDSHFNPFKYFISGGISGAIARTSTAPFNRLKILLQLDSSVVVGIASKTIRKTPSLLGAMKRYFL
jgi:solute carrier family 25 phosphate transporter 23/24/25/41